MRKPQKKLMSSSQRADRGEFDVSIIRGVRKVNAAIARRFLIDTFAM